ncbi:hypothetical protein [Janibacter limosus]|uniref:DUF559 domain-containing protein n=1 Tax=Janibacter limosus TaxID=53458 RepID=A0A4P6MUX8_9MICO|nr:hypothetical protein [Janibacter limosus]QBF45330.1 hypothetical protein EXU32_03025 [Janibacter limosus]
MGIRRDVADRLLRAASDAADPRDGVLSRADLRALGVGRDRVSSHVRAGRWRLHGRHTVALHTGELSPTAHAWRGVYESTGDARVDGVTSLKAAGVTGLTDTVVHISLHHLCQVRCIDGVVQHKVSRRLPDECALPGLPRTPPALAALRAAQWAVSDRQAALFLVLPVQQRITTAETLHVTHSQYAGRRRRALIAQLIDDIADGAHSLGELDLVPALRRRGLPTPTRQAIRRVDGRTRYLDVCWEDIGLALEIDGAAHSAGLEVTFDHFRQNAITLGGDIILRMNLIGLRLGREEFLDQVVRAHAELTAGRRG